MSEKATTVYNDKGEVTVWYYCPYIPECFMTDEDST